MQFGKTYSNDKGEPYSIERFRFYVCRIRLSGMPNKDEYFLIDFADSSSTGIALSAPAGRYGSLEFLLGVDSIRHCSGAQSGALDPAKGMFWTWNSGYVTAKLEGSSPLSAAPGHAITYHIGGYKGENKATREIHLPFPQPLEINEGKTATLIIRADVNAWFANPHPISIKTTPACTTPGALAKAFADNFANMFTVQQAINP